MLVWSINYLQNIAETTPNKALQRTPLRGAAELWRYAPHETKLNH